MIGGLFEVVAQPMEWLYGLAHNYILMIAAMAIFVIVLTAPLVLKSTKGMLEMQKLAPALRKLQQEHRNDRQKLNEEMMKLYQEHKVNPLASCFPLLLQMPVFFIMWRVLHGLTDRVTCADPPANEQLAAACKDAAVGARVIVPNFVSETSELYKSLVGDSEMLQWGFDLSISPREALAENFATGLLYALLVVAMAGLYLFQQRMVASRSQAAPTMSAAQQKIFQYLPVFFAVFMIFYLTGLVFFYMGQAIMRIGLNYYITHRFYKGEESLGQQAQRASEHARELAKKDGGGGMFAQAKRDLAAGKEKAATAKPISSKRVTPPKNRPTPPASRPPSSGRSTRPPSRHPKKK